VIPVFHRGFENGDPESGDPRSAQPSDELFCFPGKHGAADHFDPSPAFKYHGRFNKHPVLNQFG
jgi:hypothetical protein